MKLGGVLLRLLASDSIPQYGWRRRAKAMRMVIAICMLISLGGCTDGEWRAGEWNDMENMCRGSGSCDAPCRGGESSAQSGCNEAL